MKVNLGVVGFGSFSKSFLELFLKHPDIERVVGAEFLEDRRNEVMETYHLDAMYESFDEMIEKDKEINSVAIFAQRHQHGPLIIKALKAGKNVFTAVPMGCTEEEIFEIIRLVKETHLTFMMAETCYYFPCAEFCRKKFRAGEFGDFVYGEAQYYHDITAMFDSFVSQGDGWKRVAGVPPMFYSTHSMSMLCSSIDDYPVEVTCFGFEDNNGDGIYGKGMNNWDNPFSNETAIYKMSKGGFARINEFRRIGSVKPSSYITGIYGKKAIYEGSGMQHMFIKGEADGHEPEAYDVSNLINCKRYVYETPGNTEGCKHWWYHEGYSEIHHTDRLPKAYKNIHEWAINASATISHNGSHMFLADDFVRAVLSGKLPPVNAWTAAHYTLPGIIAHESAMQGGKTLKIPDVGNPPADWDLITYEKPEYYDK